MKAWELWDQMEIGQTASSPNSFSKITRKTDGLYWVDEGGEDNLLVTFDGETMCDDDWTIDYQWFQFETALDAAKNHNMLIKSEHWHHWESYESLVSNGLNGHELTGLWLIKDK